MQTRWLYWAVCFLWLAGAVGAAEAPDAAGRAPVIARQGAVTQLVEARWRRDGEGLWLTVTGLDYAEVSAIAQQVARMKRSGIRDDRGTAPRNPLPP